MSKVLLLYKAHAFLTGILLSAKPVEMLKFLCCEMEVALRLLFKKILLSRDLFRTLLGFLVRIIWSGVKCCFKS